VARGRDRHDARKRAVAALGRELSRRASSRCELCEARGSLRVVEIEPVPSQPDPASALLLCERCAEGVAGEGRHDPESLRFLEGMIWAELRPAQLAAVRWARRLAGGEVAWAREALDGLFLDPEVEALLG
jgi:protein PhnA